ncbi:MAG: LysM peptidoglycan-binding domain-containing protein [Candidatus Euphemobacter frigidus]|nr:LysM peptidoglycan-binding domain-containing protein [Candidatus Euphemobacter frigidus]MDP8274933.1 LysM peptidoglycan-binding domain-containing protein [Candidatus Euphemobacter frigidus]
MITNKFMACLSVVLIVGAASGFFSSTPSRCIAEESAAAPDAVIVKTRAIGESGNVDAFLSDVVPGWPGWSRHYWTDKELWGNQGYIIGGPRARMMSEGLLAAGLSEEITAIIETPAMPEAPLEKVDLDIAVEKASTHRVVKGECLWFIAGYDHIYANPLQWPLIYKANKDKIKNPDLIYPGQVFIIPHN